MARPTVGGFFSNWSSSDLPILEKLRVAARNNAIKVKNRSDCCGNHGEPGC
jgi:hypothetical protein